METTTTVPTAGSFQIAAEVFCLEYYFVYKSVKDIRLKASPLPQQFSI